MARRFSSEELRSLRNNIPIGRLIKDGLQIPSEDKDGLFRFVCPMCKKMNTAISLSTNLGRCFQCRKNFNTIDMVLHHRGIGFVEAVKYCQEYYQKLTATPAKQMGYKPSELPAQSYAPPREQKQSKDITTIGHVLPSLLENISILKQKTVSYPDNGLLLRIEDMERKLQILLLQMKQIESFLEKHYPPYNSSIR